jgi:hypothetical protein
LRRQRKKRFAFCLIVRGLVRLGVEKPLALGAAQQGFRPRYIVDPKRLAVIVFEVGFCEIAKQMLFADMMELPVYGALE